MSHFSVMVITDSEPNEDMLNKIMQPYHEFECTGEDDQYVQSIDRTDEVKSEYAKYLEEQPENPESFIEWIKDWFGVDMVRSGEELDLKNTHKYGYAIVGADGSVEKVVKRTNPNKKWDYWRIGGRYRSKLQVKDGVSSAVSSEPSYEWRGEDIPEGFDSACVADIDFGKMKAEAQRQRSNWVDECSAKCGMSRKDFGIACSLLKEVNAKWLAIPGDERPRGEEYHQWLRDTGYSNVADAYKNNFEIPDTDGKSIDDWIADAPTLSAFAVVEDGQWYERGRMGWWACVSDEDDHWDEKFNEMVAALKPTQWITFLDCHI